MLNMKNNSPLSLSKSSVSGNALSGSANINNNEASTGILKYLVEIASRLSELKSGMENNIKYWENLPETPAIIGEHIHETVTLGMEIEKLKKELSGKYKQARELRKNKKVLIDTLEKRAVGIHAHQQKFLGDYGIKHKEK
jgi:regulator of replication initiation timing